jgi:hypothetical protein
VFRLESDKQDEIKLSQEILQSVHCQRPNEVQPINIDVFGIRQWQNASILAVHFTKVKTTLTCSNCLIYLTVVTCLAAVKTGNNSF